MASPISIRPVVPGDFDAIVAVMDEWWQRPIRTILPRLFLDHFCHTSLLAEDLGRPIGFLIGFASPARIEESYVHAVAVSPGYRGEGLGQELYGRFFESSMVAGRPVVRAVTSPFNEQSIAFHHRLGFSVSDSMPDYDGPEQHRVVFRIDLRDGSAPYPR